MIFAAYQDPPRQNADAAFQNAHVDIHREAVYLFAAKERGYEGHERGVICAQKLFHTLGHKGFGPALSSMVTRA